MSVFVRLSALFLVTILLQPAWAAEQVQTAGSQGHLVIDDEALDGYLYVVSGIHDEIYFRPGFCETGSVDGLVVQYVPTASPSWKDYVPVARSALVVSQYWDKDNCASRKTLNVKLRLVYGGVEHTQFTATISNADKISAPQVTQLISPPEPTPFSEALSRLRMENFMPRLPEDWVPGSPPGLSSQADPRYEHALFVEGLAAKPGPYEWTEDSTRLFQMASNLGHRGATEQLLEQVDFTSTVSRVFYNLSQGNAPIDNDMRNVMATHGALFETAVAQRIGKYVTLQERFAEYNYSVADGVIELNEGATPNHYELTAALNTMAGDVLNPTSKAYIAVLGLPAETGWQCDGTWCSAIGGLAKVRMLARSKDLDCTLSGDSTARCAFNLIHVMRGHDAMQGTAQQEAFDLVMQPARAVPRRASVDLVRQNGGWSIVSLIELE